MPLALVSTLIDTVGVGEENPKNTATYLPTQYAVPVKVNLTALSPLLITSVETLLCRVKIAESKV